MKRCLVIGAGKMGIAHLQVLVALAPDALAAWAPSDRRRAAVEEAGAQMLGGSLDEALADFGATHVFIASPVHTLVSIALRVLASGVRHILLEKPAALTLVEGHQLLQAADKAGARIFVGYNRRFYASVLTALSLIEASSERIESVVFEFNEVVADPAGPKGHAQEVRERWLLANSMHVIDTAFHAVGLPDTAKSHYHRSAPLSWHAAGGVFVGSGETLNGVPFAYHANWQSPGRWGFEWMTPSTRYVFRPMEKLFVMRRGQFTMEPVDIGDEMDLKFKPGVYGQNRAFLRGDLSAGLVTLDAAVELIALAHRMAGYEM
ncbi:MAG: Gfo/Idh/MocA family oxidoreductase [Pseudomonadota bacterium]